MDAKKLETNRQRAQWILASVADFLKKADTDGTFEEFQTHLTIENSIILRPEFSPVIKCPF